MSTIQKIIYTSLFAVLFSVLTGFLPLKAQIVLDRWDNTSTGFAKCAQLGQAAGEADFTRDDFQILQLIDRRGEMYAFVTYGANATNTASCSEGLFRYDSVQNKWFRVANSYPKAYTSAKLYTNHTDIFAIANGMVYRFTENYAAFPDGWENISRAPHRPLRGEQVFTSACSPSNSWEALQFQTSEVQAIGDTIYIWTNAKSTAGCDAENKILKFSIPDGTWTFDLIGKMPHQIPTNDGTSDQHYSFAITSRIAGIFQYFIAYTWRGGTKCYPDYAFVWDPRTSQWQNISEGINWNNQTGSSNPEPTYNGKPCPLHNSSKSVNKWGPNGGFYVSWDRRKIYATSEMGIWRWAGDKWYWIGDNRENSSLIPTETAIFTRGRDRGIEKLRQTNYSLVGDGSLPVGIGSNYRILETPDDGKTLFSYFTSDNKPELNGIYVLRFDPDKPERVRNLNIETGTYIGGSGGDNTSINVGIGANYTLFVAGNYPTVDAKGKPYLQKNLNGTTNSARGKIIRYTTFGDSIISVATFGNQITDFEIQNFGEYRMVLAGDWGITVVDSAAQNVIYTIASASLPGSAAQPIYVDIDDKGNVAVLRDKRIVVYDKDGNQKTNIITDDGKLVVDITIHNDTVFVIGEYDRNFQKVPSTVGCADAGGYLGQPVRAAYIKAWANVSGTLTFLYKTWGFDSEELYGDMADAIARKINVGKDGKLYYLGESAGPNSIYRWNGKQARTQLFYQTGVCKDPTNTLIITDIHSNPVNQGAAAHIGYFCTVTPATGVVERGQYIIPRRTDGKSNTYSMSNGYITADQAGYVYIGAKSSFAFGGRQIQHVNGQLVGEYAGDMVIAIISPDYRQRTFWGTFSDSLGEGTVKGIGTRDNIVAIVGNQSKGKMITGSTKVIGAGYCAKEFKKEYAIRAEPFNLDWNNTVTNDDSYLAVWYQDVWNHSVCDSLEERKIASNPVVTETEFNYKPNFDADKKIVCVKSPITITNTSVGDSINHTWNFGKDASLLPGTKGAGPWSLSYSTAGFKTIRLQVMLKNKVTDFEEKFNFINVLSDTLKISGLTGASQICAGNSAIFSVNKIWDVTFEWELPTGAKIIDGMGGNVVRIQFADVGGQVKVKGKYACGYTNELAMNVAITPASANTVLLVVGNTTLNAGDVAIKNKIEAMGYGVLVMSDAAVDASHAGCVGLVVISSSANANLVNFKFREVTTPVIVANPAVFAAMGMTNGGTNDFGALANQTNIDIRNVTHELASPLTTGSNQVYSKPANVNWGVPAATAIQIASSNADATRVSIFGYEAGMPMQGYTAPGKRVGFFMSWQGADVLTNDVGDVLLARAVCWATSKCPNPQTITTQPLAVASLCPNGEVDVPFVANGSFKPVIVTPSVGQITLDNTNTSGQYSDVTYNTWSNGPNVSGSNISSGFNGTNYRFTSGKAANVFAEFRPIITYSGTYEVALWYPAHPSNASNVSVNIYHKAGTTTQIIDQKTDGGQWKSIGTYYFEPSTAKAIVRIRTDGAIGTYVVADAIRLTPITIKNDTIRNTFTAQLSNMYGQFANPTVIGTLADSVSGIIKAKIPFNLPTGSNYRIRVISSVPSVNGTDNGTDLLVGGLPPRPAAINGAASACRGQSIQTYHVTPVVGITQYQWVTPLGTAIQGAPQNRPNELITGKTATIDFGLATTNEIKVYSVNQCGRSEQPARLTVAMTARPPAAPDSIVGKKIVCQGATETYTASISEAATGYKWYVPTGVTIVSGDSSPSAVLRFTSIANHTTDTIKVRAFGACGLSDATTRFVVRIDNVAARPVIDTIFGNLQVCQGVQGAIYRIDPIPNVSGYTWTVPSGASFTGTQNEITVNFGTATSGQITASATNSCGTGTPKALNITVNSGNRRALLVVNNKVTPLATDQQMADTLANAGYSVSFASDNEQPTDLNCYALVIISTSANSTNIGTRFKNISPPLISLNPATYQNLGFTTNTFSTQANQTSARIVTSELTTGLAAGDVPIWSSSLTATRVPPITSAVIGARSAGSTNNTQVILFGIEQGVLLDGGTNAPSRRVGFALNNPALLNDNGWVLFRNAACWATNTCNVTTPPAITTSAITPTNLCAGGTVTVPFVRTGVFNSNNVFTAVLSDINGSFASGTTVIGTLNGTVSGSISATIPANVVAGNTYRIRVVSNSPTVIGAANAVNLTILTAPATPSIITGEDTLCTGSTNVIYNVTSVSGLTYQWLAPTGASGTATANSYSLNANTAFTDTLKVRASNGCLSSDWSKKVLVSINKPAQPTDLTIPANLCEGITNFTITVPNPDPKTTSYQWKLSNGAIGNSHSATMNIVSTASLTGNNWVSVSAVGKCGNSDTTLKNIPLQKAPNQPDLSGTDTLCANSSSAVSFAAVATATSYQWSLSSGISGNSTTNNLSFSVANQSGSLAVKALNFCGESPTATKNIVVILPPTTANAGTDKEICTTNAVLQANSPTNGKGKWTVVSGTATFANDTLFNSSVSGLSTGENVLRWTISTPKCTPSSATVKLTRLVLPDAANAGNDVTTCNSSISLSANTPSVGTGKWYILQGGSNINNPNIANPSITNLSIGDNSFVWEISNSCAANRDTVLVKVEDCTTTPAFELSAHQLCISNALTITNKSVGATSYQWNFGTDAVPSSATTATPPTVTYTSAGQKKISLTIVGKAGTRTLEKDVLIDALSPQADAGTNLNDCGTDIQLKGVPPPFGQGTWQALNQPLVEILNPNDATTYVNNLPQGTTEFIWTVVNGLCPATSAKITVTMTSCPDLFVPTGFAPLANGKESVWNLEGIDRHYPNSSIQVFNRWGGVVFQSVGYEKAWDGRENGGEISFGTYIYIINLSDGRKLQGTVTVLK